MNNHAYNVYKNKIKDGEQTLDFLYHEKTIDLKTCLYTNYVNISGNIEMERDSFLPIKITYSRTYDNMQDSFEIKFDNYILTNMRDRLWYRSKMFDNCQVVFMLPLLLTHANHDIYNTEILNVFLSSANSIIKYYFKKHPKENGNQTYGAYIPVNYLAHYGDDFLLEYYHEKNRGIEIRQQ